MLSPLAEQLYDYATNTRLDGQFTDGEDEYFACLLQEETLLPQLEDTLHGPERKLLDDYLQARDTLDYFNRHALFSAGLSLGLQLARLG